MKVLVVEDDRKMAALLERGLKEHGFLVKGVRRGDEALELIPQSTHDAVVSESPESHVFQRFHRGATATTLGIEGCGLGLSIALSMAQAHCGALTFKSPSGNTEFSPTLGLRLTTSPERQLGASI